MDSSNFTTEILRQINIFSITIIVVLGIVGHYFIVLVYSRKKFCRNSAHVYLLCLAISDGMFLIVHFFEVNIQTWRQNLKIILSKLKKSETKKDTVRTFQDVFLVNMNRSISDSHFQLKEVFKTVNLIDKNDLACSLVNYLRNVSRFTSAYISKERI